MTDNVRGFRPFGGGMVSFTLLSAPFLLEFCIVSWVSANRAQYERNGTLGPLVDASGCKAIDAPLSPSALPTERLSSRNP